MFGYTPYQDAYRSSAYRPSPYATADPYSNPYYRALAEEQAARDQYAAALRAQEEARERAARARRMQEAYKPYASPYNSYLNDLSDPEDENPYYANPYTRGYGGAYDLYATELERERKRRELMELQRQREREAEMQRLRERERELERLRMLEEERRRLLEEERRKREMAALEEERERRRRAEAAAQEFFRNYGRGRMFPNEQAYRDKQMGHKRSTSTFPNSGTGAPKQAPPVRKAPSRSPNPSTRRTASAQPTERTRIPIRTPSPRQPAQPPSPKPQYTKEQIAAAEKIQSFLRTHFPRHQALKQISSIERRFEELKSGFSFPATIDFALSPSSEDNIVSVDTASLRPLPPAQRADVSPPNLPYTHNNTPLHAYDHTLGQLLSQLDAVPSGGDARVRERRKEVVRRVQGEVTRVEEWRLGLWAAWVQMDKMKNEGAQTPREVEDGVPRMEFQKESEAERREDEMCLDSVGVPGEHSEQPPQEAPRDSEMAVDRPETAAEGQSSEPRASQDQRDDSSAPTHQGEDGAVHNQPTSSEADVPHSPQVTSPAAVHAGDDGVEVEHIEEASAPVPVSQLSSMDVDQEEGLPEPPIKIKVEPADPEILASVAPEVSVEEPASTEEAVVSSAGDESRPSAIEKDVPKDGGMEVDGDTHRVEDVPAASDLSKSDPSLEEPLAEGKDGMMEIDGQHSSQDESEATVQPAEPDTLPHAHQPVVQEPPEPPTTTAAEEVSSPLSEPETEAPRTPPPPSQVQVQGEQQKAQPLYDADERTMDEFVML